MATATVLLVLHLTIRAAPLTLDDALSVAVKRNTDLQLARADEQGTEVDLRQSYQAVLPRLDLNGAFGYQWQGASQQVNVVPNPDNPTEFVRTPVTFPSSNFGAHQVGLNLTWTFFDGLASWNGIAAARTRVASAHRQYEELALRTSFEVTRRFYELVKQERAMEVRRGTVALSQDLVKRSDALFAAGRGTKADTYAARVNLGNDEIALQTQAAAVARARADLALALGLTSPEGLEIVQPATVDGPLGPVAEEPPPLPGLIASARKRRPLIDSRKLSGDAADLDVSKAQGAWWPVVGLQASYFRASPDLTGTNGVFGPLANNYIASVQATLAWNIFAGGETRAGIDRAEVLASRAQTLLAQGEQQVVAEVVVAREQVVVLNQAVVTARQILDAAEKSLQFAREQLEVRLASQLEVRDAALRLAQAKLTWVNTVIDLVVARADLNRAVGGAL